MKLSDLKPGESAWCDPSALVQDADAALWLLADAGGQLVPDQAATLRVARSAEGFDVDRAHCRDHPIAAVERPDERFVAAYDHTRDA